MAEPMVVEAHGAAIPALGLGTWPLAGDACARAVETALLTGYRHIDTASMYGNEDAVGEGVRASRVSRDRVFVTSKVWWTELRDGALQRSCEASLTRLKIEPIDLFLVHWPNAAVPLKETMRALASVKREGMVRHIGVSNFTPDLLDEAVHHCPEPLVANQCEYHPRVDQSATLAATRRHGLAFISYAPLGKGGRDGLLAERVIRDIAERHGRTPAQIVLRWHVQQDGVAAIPKSGNADRIHENFAVFDFQLDEDEMAAISRLGSPEGRMLRPDFGPNFD